MQLESHEKEIGKNFAWPLAIRGVLGSRARRDTAVTPFSPEPLVKVGKAKVDDLRRTQT